MKLMVSHISAKEREEAPHANTTTQNIAIHLNGSFTPRLKRQAQFVINDRLVDAETRALVSRALEGNDPSLPALLRRVDADETAVDPMHYSETGVIIEDEDSVEEKVEALADMICRAGDEPAKKSAALLVLMATLENASDPKALANSAKHVAFIHCGQLNVYGIVDAHIPVLESELFTTGS
jgi:hypothetical protein